MNISIALGPFGAMPPVGCGAVETLWCALAQAFQRKGEYVTVFGRRHEGQRINELVDGVRYVRWSSFERTNSTYLDLAKDLLYSVGLAFRLPHADILITNSFWLPITACIRGRSVGRVVVNVARMPKGQLWLYSQAARLCVVSTAVFDAVQQQTPTLIGKTRVIPNPIDTDVFVPPDLPRDRSKVQTVLYTGRLHPEKGLELLIEAFRQVAGRFQNVALRLVGPWRLEEGGGGRDYLERLQHLASGMPVSFVGPIYDKRLLAEELKLAHIYCYPSLAEKGESFGVAPLEAMGTGLAPIVSDLECFREFLTPGENGLVFDHREEAAASQLAELFFNALIKPAWMEDLGKAAATRARMFGFDAVADMYINEFQDLLKSK